MTLRKTTFYENEPLDLLTEQGTLTLDSGGKMTNPNEDFTITDNGIRVKNGTTYPSPRAYALVNSSDSVVANLWYNQGINEIRLQSSGPLLRILNGGGGDVEMASTTGNVLFRGLKTSDPGVAGAIWRDGTNLRISTG